MWFGGSAIVPTYTDVRVSREGRSPKRPDVALPPPSMESHDRRTRLQTQCRHRVVQRPWPGFLGTALRARRLAISPRRYPRARIAGAGDVPRASGRSGVTVAACGSAWLYARSEEH